MDNFRIDVTHDTDEMLAKALDIGFGGKASSRRAIGYRIDPEKGFVLYWTTCDGSHPFPVKMGPEEMLVVLKAWLKECGYPAEPDIDGSVKRGWRLYNENWGHVGSDWQAFLALQPKWTVYGK